MNITLENLIEEIAKFTKKDPATIAEETPLKKLVIESFVLVEMVIELQEVFSVRLNQNDLANVNIVSDLLSVLQKNESK